MALICLVKGILFIDYVGEVLFGTRTLLNSLVPALMQNVGNLHDIPSFLQFLIIDIGLYTQVVRYIFIPLFTHQIN